MKLILAAALLICVLTNATEEPSSNSANPEDPWEELSHETALTKKPVVRRTQQWSKNKVEEDLVQDGYGRRVRKRIENHRVSTAPRREQRKERFAKLGRRVRERILTSQRAYHEAAVKKASALAAADAYHREKMMGAMKEEAMSHMKARAVRAASSYRATHHDRRRSKSHTNRLEEELVQGEWGERDA